LHLTQVASQGSEAYFQHSALGRLAPH